jgi:hypothetical protein
VEYLASSLGRLSHRFLAQLLFALEGQYYGKAEVPLYKRNNHVFRIRFPSARAATVAPNCKRRLDIYSLPVVPGSDEAEILDAALVDYEQGQLLSHSKVLRVNWEDGMITGTYVCITSANLSPTAWGGSWECGVLMKGTHARKLDIGLAGPRYQAKDKWM